MIYINLEANSPENIEKLFNIEEVYSDTIVILGDKLGFIKNGSSCGEIFYFLKGTLKNTTVILKSGEKIELGY